MKIKRNLILVTPTILVMVYAIGSIRSFMPYQKLVLSSQEITIISTDPPVKGSREKGIWITYIRKAGGPSQRVYVRRNEDIADGAEGSIRLARWGFFCWVKAQLRFVLRGKE